MLPGWLVSLCGVGLLGALFLVALWGDRRAERGRSIVANPWVYGLSMAVYITGWGFYGNIGLVARQGGIEYVPLHIGPTLVAVLGWLVIRKLIRISREQRLGSIADFISARYGNSSALGALVAVAATVGMTPYIAVQLQSIASSYRVVTTGSPTGEVVTPWLDVIAYVTVVLALFCIMFSARKLDAGARHEGLIASIALEALIKLLAFMIAGAVIVFVTMGGPGALFAAAAGDPQAGPAMYMTTASVDFYRWGWLLFLSMTSFLMLPRQFQVVVVENHREDHLRTALWLFPAYLLLLSLFTLPVALAGLLRLGAGFGPDFFLLGLPMQSGQPALTLLVFLGGLSAATAMVIMETVALSTMVCNNLVMPALLRSQRIRNRRLPALILGTRRLAIVATLTLAYAYGRGEQDTPFLAETGMISFAAAAQFAPALIGGLYWREGHRSGALSGLLAGFLLWLYCLALPHYAGHGGMLPGLLSGAPFGQSWLNPHALFGLTGLDPLAHGMFWSLLANLGCYVLVSLFCHHRAIDRSQADRFVDAMRSDRGPRMGTQARVDRPRLLLLLHRTLGPALAGQAIRELALGGNDERLDTKTLRAVEQLLVGAVGPSGARMLLGEAVYPERIRDPSTGLPNLAGLLAALDESRRATQAGRLSGFAVLVIRLDQYRQIAGNLDQSMAQQLVAAVAARLQPQLPATGLLASLGGNRLGVLLNDIDSLDQAQRIAEALQTSAGSAIELPDHTIYPTTTVGIACSLGAEAPDELLQNAETALRLSSRHGSNEIGRYHASMRTQGIEAMRLRGDLHRALERREFALHYQPLVALADGRLIGFEALLRWWRADVPVPPDRFIPMCEESGLIVPLGDWVLNTACAQLGEWRRRHPGAAEVSMSINVSPLQMRDDRLLTELPRALARSGLPSRAIKLEITENQLVANLAHTRSLLTRLRGHGAQVLVDDFGTGYSSLSYLRELPVDMLKIDQSFVRRMDSDPKRQEIVEHLVSLTHSLNLEVVAEGVETARQARQLWRLRTDYGQGYHFSPPLPPGQAEDLLARGARWPIARS